MDLEDTELGGSTPPHSESPGAFMRCRCDDGGDLYDVYEDDLEGELLRLRLRLAECEAELERLRAQDASHRSLLTQLQDQLLMSMVAPIASGKVHCPRDTPLVIAVSNGDIECVRQLIEAGADPSADGNTPLLRACQFGHVTIAEYLLGLGADIHVDFDSPLLWAVNRNDHALVDALLERGANPNTLNGCALRVAVNMGATAIVGALLKAGARAR